MCSFYVRLQCSFSPFACTVLCVCARYTIMVLFLTLLVVIFFAMLF